MVNLTMLNKKMMKIRRIETALVTVRYIHVNFI